MTDDIMAPTDPVRRDRWGRYLVVPPEGGKPQGYTRATTIAKTLDDTSSLMAWGERMTAIGLARRPDLVATIDSVANDKQALNRLCTAAKEAGGATVRRDLGTQVHSILERWWTEPGFTPPAAHIADVNAVVDALAAHGLEVVDGMHERIVVNDQHRIAGTFDLLLRDRSGATMIADIKTGSSVKFGALGFAVQLSIYASADNLYRQGAAKDGSDDIRDSMPEVRQDQAIIIHVEPGSGVCTLHRLTLEPELLDLAMTVREMRKRKDLLAELTDDDRTPRDKWFRERVAAVVAVDKRRIAESWPQHIATPSKRAGAYSDAEIDEMLPMLEQVESMLEMPFAAPDPSAPAAQQRRTPQAAQTPEMPDEGPIVDDQAERLRQRFDNLDDTAKQFTAARVKEAEAAHLPIRVNQLASTRRVRLAEAMMDAMQRHGDDAAGKLRDLAAVALDDDTVLMDSVPLGAVLGLHDHQQAATLAELISLGATVEG